jgi:hypothetical protein
MSSPIARLLYLSLLGTSLVIPMGSRAKAAVIGNCTPAKVAFSASATDGSQSTSPTFSNIPEATVAFIQGGSTASCVIVHFTSMDAVGANGQLFVRAVMDHGIVGLPELFQIMALGNDFSQTNTAIFIFPSVAPGKHQVRMQFSSPNGQLVSVGRHNTVVNYSP